MESIIHCSLRIRGTQRFQSFDLLHDDADKPYAEIGKNKDGEPIHYFFDPAQIIPDRVDRVGHFEYLSEIVIS